MTMGYIWKAAGTMVLAGAALFAQGKAPAPKSQKELEALQAIQNAPDPDKRIAAVENLLTNFADTDFKIQVLQIAMDSARQKNDYEKTIVYGERTLEADPKNYSAMLTLASVYAQRTKEFDLDRDEKLNKADKYAHSALDLIATATKPRPDFTDEQWDQAKKDLIGEAHEALGMSAATRKKYDVAITEYQTAITTSATPDPATSVRLADAYLQSNKPDEAISTVNKLLATPNLNPAVKRVADDVKDKAQKVKAGSMKVAPTDSGNGPAQVEIKK